MDKFEWFKNEFENLSTSDQIEIFNSYCRENQYEDEIYSMDEFDEIFADRKPSEIFEMTLSNKDDVDLSDKYFVVTIYGFQTFNDPYDFIQDYIGGIFRNEDVWDLKIDSSDYISDLYDEHLDLKPEDMDDDEFYDIVEDAALTSDFESDIVSEIKKAISEYE